MNNPLPYGRQTIDEDDIASVVEVLRGDWLTTGPAVAAFETAFAEQVAAKYAVACGSGTAGLHLAAIALGLDSSDTVVVPTITFLATANAARYVGAEVQFADVDPDTGLMTADSLGEAMASAEKAGRKVTAVFPVHLNGQCVEMRDIAGVAEGLRIVEDACHVLGGSYENVPAGSCRHAEMAVFSFHPVKTIAMGEGGAVATNDPALRDRLQSFRNHGMVRDSDDFENRDMAFDESGEANPWYYEMSYPGFNYRASDMHCALGLAQLSKLDRFVSKRAELVARYDSRLAELSPLVRPLARVPTGSPAWHLYVALIDFDAAAISRAALMKNLRAKGVGTQVHYIPVHHQPYYCARYGRAELPGAERYYQRALSLPLFATMTEQDVDRVVEALAECLSA
tara:strand:- start:79 stop:1269 length:1191 start_codon:yes stop_codon:yes gene_type:complete